MSKKATWQRYWFAFVAKSVPRATRFDKICGTKNNRHFEASHTRGPQVGEKSIITSAKKTMFFHLKLSLRVGVKFSKTILTVFYTLGLITIQYIIRLNFWCLETVNCSHKSKMTQYFLLFWNILGQIKLFCTKSCALR